MNEQYRMNALRFKITATYLDRSLQELDGVNLRSITGSRNELAEYRARAKSAREHIALALQDLAELERVRKQRLALNEASTGS